MTGSHRRYLLKPPALEPPLLPVLLNTNELEPEKLDPMLFQNLGLRRA